MRLSEDAEECATFYGKMLDHDYTTKEVFNKNFFKDWRKSMTDKEKEKIRDLSKCDFSEINTYFKKVIFCNFHRGCPKWRHAFLDNFDPLITLFITYYCSHNVLDPLLPNTSV